MTFSEKLLALRKREGLSQEQLAQQLSVTRQAVTKWEQGAALPEMDRAIALCQMYRLTLDSLFLPTEECAKGSRAPQPDTAEDTLIGFLLRAKKATYAAHGAEAAPSRKESHDLAYTEGDYAYYDTYLGGEKFAGEEAVWIKGKPVWAMNYVGRVTGDGFSGDFLKEALINVPKAYPYRGPLFFRQGDFSYHAMIDGGFAWFTGTEEIFLEDRKVFECRFHGGSII